MFTELPKLFDRDFAIGYFLPIACFFGAVYRLLVLFHVAGVVPHLAIAKDISPLLGTTIVGLIAWLAGVALVAWNRSLYQLFEGYKWPLNTQLGRRIESQRFERLLIRIDAAYREDPKKTSNDLLQERADLLIERAEHFPYRKRDVLATRFGNTIRAFETYPKAMYGIESIEGWLRLLAVIPKDYRRMIASAKTQTDFWLNTWFLSYITAAFYLVLAAWHHLLSAIWFVPVCLLLVVVARSAAITAAKEWGAIFKSSFDVFLPELYKRLCLVEPSVINTIPEKAPEWLIWDAFSKAITYRDPSQLPPRRLGRKNLQLTDEADENEEEDNTSESCTEDIPDEDTAETKPSA